MRGLDVVHWGGRHAPAPVVCATSAWNGLGFSPYQTWAFRRAELTCFAETPFRLGNGNRASMAHIRTLPTRSFGLERLIPVATRLVDELVPSLATLPPEARLALVLCLDERFGPGASAGFARQRQQFESAVVARLVLARSAYGGGEVFLHTVPRGHASLAFALIEAGSALASDRIDAAVVGGVDTSYDPDVVEALMDAGRIFDGENLDSAIPGEGGAFMLLADAGTARRARWKTLARVESAATNQEPGVMSSEVPCMGLGLSRALRAVADRLQEEKRNAEWWIGDLTNQEYRSHEFSLAFPRACVGVSAGELAIEFLPVHLGDLGAATMPTAAVIAAEGFLRGDPDASNCLLMASSVGEDRGAVLLARPGPG